MVNRILLPNFKEQDTFSEKILDLWISEYQKYCLRETV